MSLPVRAVCCATRAWVRGVGSADLPGVGAALLGDAVHDARQHAGMEEGVPHQGQGKPHAGLAGSSDSDDGSRRMGLRVHGPFKGKPQTFLLPGAATWWSFVLIYDNTANDSLLPLIPFILVLVVDVFLFWPQIGPTSKFLGGSHARCGSGNLSNLSVVCKSPNRSKRLMNLLLLPSSACQHSLQ